MYLSKDTFVEPDLVIYPKGIKLEEVQGTDIVLAIEVALTSLAFDRGLKAQIYAHYGVRELWVIDAKQRRAHLHTGPKAGAWEDVVERGPQEVLTCAAVPGFSATLGAI
jgi:Uma2 family endonuclease